MDTIPKLLIDFLIVTSFSLLIGKEQKRHFAAKGAISFGTDRTFTFIGIFGFVLSLQNSLAYFLSGLVSLNQF